MRADTYIFKFHKFRNTSLLHFVYKALITGQETPADWKIGGYWWLYFI